VLSNNNNYNNTNCSFVIEHYVVVGNALYILPVFLQVYSFAVELFHEEPTLYSLLIVNV